MKIKAVLAAAAFVALIPGGVPAALAAGPSQSQPISWLQDVDNPCTPAVEQIDFSGRVQFSVTESTAPDGTPQVTVRSNVKAAGQDSAGVRYQLSAADDITYAGTGLDFNPRDPAQGPIKDMYRFHVTSQGSAPNFVINSLFRMDAAGVTMEKLAGSDCRG